MLAIHNEYVHKIDPGKLEETRQLEGVKKCKKVTRNQRLVEMN